MQRKKLRRYEGVYNSRFLTFSCYERRNLLGSPEVRDEFVARLEYVHSKMAVDLYYWVVMLNHVHLIVRPASEDATIAQYLHLLKRTFAYRQMKFLRACGIEIPRFWQAGGGYDRNLYSDEEFSEKTDYIHENPVRAELVLRAEDWRWSSVGWPEKFWTQL
ncbi:MAG: transposase [Armatimonadetes bacterium]|nr:transposase [Armatimonadota bacterium]